MVSFVDSLDLSAQTSSKMDHLFSDIHEWHMFFSFHQTSQLLYNLNTPNSNLFQSTEPYLDLPTGSSTVLQVQFHVKFSGPKINYLEWVFVVRVTFWGCCNIHITKWNIFLLCMSNLYLLVCP